MVSLVLLVTAIVYYSILSDTLISLQKKNLSLSLNNFISYIQNFSQQLDNFFYQFYKKNKDIDQLKNNKVDFILYAQGEFLYPVYISDKFKISSNRVTIAELKSTFSNLYIKKTELDNKIFYYGKFINSDFLNTISQKINAEVVLFSDKVIIDASNSSENQNLFFILLNANQELHDDKKFSVFEEENNSNNILSTYYKPIDIDNSLTQISFLIFNKIEEYSQLKNSFKNLLFIIGISGVGLSIILAYIFSIKIRKQLDQLSAATESIKEGNFNVKINLKGNDEFTHLGETFNLMTEKLKKNQKILKDYSDFITLLNQKSTLTEIAEIALDKIISTYKFSIGAIYLVEDEYCKIIATQGINFDYDNRIANSILNQVVDKKEKLILNFDSNIPSIKTGIIDIKLNHLILHPILYAEKVIAILELVSQNPLSEESIDYLNKIQEQLAISLINAKSVSQLENYVVELKKLNEELKQSNLQIIEQNKMLTDLSDTLMKQTSELSIQKQRAEESTKLKSEFIANISHELKTPLNSIIGLTELMIANSNLDNKNLEKIKVIQRSGKRLIDLINDLLNYSQIESGKLTTEFKEFILDEFINQIISEVESLLIKKKLKFSVNRKFKSPFKIYSDKEKLYQIILNLLDNAIKFTNEGFVDFTIITVDNQYIEFIIADSGIGISDSHKDLIFEEFRQADGSLSRKFDGTGLGLAISKKLTELIGGRIWFESKLNIGSKFYVQIPVKNLNHPAQDNFIIKEKFLDDSKSNFTIMVVDDDADCLFTISEILNTFGFQNIAVRSGIECLKLLENLTPDLILLDIMMPDMDGFQTINKIRYNRNYDKIPIIAVTAKAMENSAYIIKQSGFDDCIFKPVNSQQLYEKIQYHLILKINKYEKAPNN